MEVFSRLISQIGFPIARTTFSINSSRKEVGPTK